MKSQEMPLIITTLLSSVYKLPERVVFCRAGVAVKSVLVETGKGSDVEVEGGNSFTLVATKISPWLDFGIE